MSDTAAGGAQQVQQAITGSMVRSGLNPTAAVAAGEQVGESNARSLMSDEAKATQARLQGLTNYNTTTLDASAKPEQMEQGLTATEQGGADATLGQETDASKTPSFWQELGEGVIKGGDAFAGGVGSSMCPAEGSLYLMADGTEVPVETLRVGDELRGIDGETETIELIESTIAPILLVLSDHGHRLRNSRSHAYALPGGGFTVASRSLGRKLVADRGPARVISVEDAGMARVYSVITGGSNTYRADGVWALGAGEDARLVQTEERNRIAEEVR